MPIAVKGQTARSDFTDKNSLLCKGSMDTNRYKTLWIAIYTQTSILLSSRKKENETNVCNKCLICSTDCWSYFDLVQLVYNTSTVLTTEFNNMC